MLDTNIAVSALLWRGTPSRLAALAAEGRCRLYASAARLDELADVLSRKKLARAVARTGSTADQLHSEYKRLARRVRPDALTERVARDAYDDAVLACELAARAELIVSGDVHLLELGAFRTIPIARASEAARRVGGRAA